MIYHLDTLPLSMLLNIGLYIINNPFSFFVLDSKMAVVIFTSEQCQCVVSKDLYNITIEEQSI